VDREGNSGALRAAAVALAVLALLAAAGTAVFAVLALREAPAPPPPVAAPLPVPPPPPPPPPPPSEPAAPEPPAAVPPEPDPPPIPPPDPRETFVRVQKLIHQNNLAGLVAAALYFSGRSEEYRKVRAKLLRDDLEIRDAVRMFPRHPEFRTLPVRLEPDDSIVAFAGQVLHRSDPKPFVERLTAWLRSYQPGSMAVVTLSRRGTELTVPLYFPERDADARTLIDRLR